MASPTKNYERRQSGLLVPRKGPLLSGCWPDKPALGGLIKMPLMRMGRRGHNCLAPSYCDGCVGGTAPAIMNVTIAGYSGIPQYPAPGGNVFNCDTSCMNGSYELEFLGNSSFMSCEWRTNIQDGYVFLDCWNEEPYSRCAVDIDVVVSGETDENNNVLYRVRGLISFGIADEYEEGKWAWGGWSWFGLYAWDEPSESPVVCSGTGINLLGEIPYEGTTEEYELAGITVASAGTLTIDSVEF